MVRRRNIHLRLHRQHRQLRLQQRHKRTHILDRTRRRLQRDRKRPNSQRGRELQPTHRRQPHRLPPRNLAHLPNPHQRNHGGELRHRLRRNLRAGCEPPETDLGNLRLRAEHHEGFRPDVPLVRRRDVLPDRRWEVEHGRERVRGDRAGRVDAVLFERDGAGGRYTVRDAEGLSEQLAFVISLKDQFISTQADRIAASVLLYSSESRCYAKRQYVYRIW